MIEMEASLVSTGSSFKLWLKINGRGNCRQERGRHSSRKGLLKTDKKYLSAPLRATREPEKRSEGAARKGRKGHLRPACAFQGSSWARGRAAAGLETQLPVGQRASLPCITSHSLFPRWMEIEQAAFS